MNKTYKTIWNYSLGEWVAASELAKGHGKSSSNLGKAALALAVTVSSMTGAYAVTNISGGPSGSPAPKQSITDTEVNINVGGGTNTGYFNSTTGTTIVVSGTGDTKVTAENINVSASNTGGYATAMSITGSAGAHLELKGNNTLTLDASTGDTGVISSTSAGGGDAKITVEGTFTLNNNANWRQFENDGLEANAGSGGSAIITHTGTGTISIAGGHAIQARANAAGKDVEVTMNSSAGKDGIHLITTGNSDVSSPGSGSAIGAKGSSANGKVTVNTNAKITTTGSGAHGIYATSAGKAADGKSIDITNSGTISATGTGSKGIMAQATAATANGTVDITNTGDINSGSHALHGLGYNGDVTIHNDGKLTTTDYDGAGIRAEQDINSTTGNITVTTGANSQITTNDSQADGIHAYLGQEDGGGGAASNGNVTVDAQGSIKTNGTSSAEGIFAAISNSNATGDIDVTFRGSTIETTGTGVSRGILVRQMGSGDVTVKHHGDLIKTAGAGAHGISIATGLAGTNGGTSATVGRIDVDLTGKIETQGNSAKGIQVDLRNQSDGVTITSTSDIKTQGNSAAAIEILANYGVTDTGKITIDQTGGRFETDGASSHGIYVYTNAQQGDIEVNLTDTVMDLKGGNSDGIGIFQTSANSDTDIVVNTSGGSITLLDNPTSGGIANYGIVVYQDNNADGNITINNAGTDITTKLGTDGLANGSDAIYAGFRNNASGATGDVKVTNTGTLSTQGVNSVGIRATNNGSGKVDVQNNANITTAGASSHGIRTVATTGDTSIRVGADSIITTQGNNAIGIYASSSGGLIDIYNAGKISTLDTTGTTTSTGRSHAILGEQTTTGNSSGIKIFVEDTTLSTKNYDATGVRAHTFANSGDVDVIVKTTEINVDGINADGILAQKSAAATDTSDLDVNVTVIDSKINVLKNPSLAGNGTMNFGIAAVQQGVAAGDINIINSNTDITVGKGQSGNTNYSGAIYAVYSSANATGNIDIKNDGNLTSDSDGSMGLIYASNAGSGNVDVLNLGDITANGDGASGIYAASGNGGNVTINSTGDITLTKTSHIATTAVGINAIANNGGNAVVNASGHISVMGDSSTTSTPTMIAIDVSANQGQSTVNLSDALIEAHTTAIKVSDNGSGLGTQGTINLGPNTVVHSTSSYALEAWVTGGNTINIDATSVIQGKQGIYILSGSTAKNEINNWGLIDVGHDIAIKDDSTLGSETVVNNWGTIIGQYSFGAGSDVTVNNYSHNSINLRNFTDSDGDGIRDTHGVAVLDHGLGGWTTVNNDATGTVRLALITNEINIDATGEYVPVGALSINNQGIAHGHILNLDEFNNAGLIELSTNKMAGDVLVITGGDTAGVGSTGTYVTNSGSLSVDTRINQGGTASLSDVLVLDNIRMGTGATMVHVNPTADGAGGLTQGDGIKIIEVLGSQDADAFALAAPVTYGAYDYLLMQGSTQRSNWFLRNNANGKIFYSPVVGAYLGNQHAASTMFNHNILDRRDNVRSPDQTVWGRINYSDLKTDLFDGSAETKIDSYLMQFGVDILKRNDWVAGAYIGYGHSDIDNKSTITNVSADGKVKGYQIGAYASWMPQENKGPYLDLWGHVARYSNDLSGATGKGSYDSTGYALSIEGGHAFELGKSDDGKAWILEPHAQLIYNYLNADDFSINNTRYHGNDSSGIQTRLGARFYMQRAGGHDGVVPFVEANWLGNYTSNKVKANNDKVSSDIGKNVGELKLGLQGKVNDRFSVWGHLGGQAGSESYRRYEAQFGLGYEW